MMPFTHKRKWVAGLLITIIVSMFLLPLVPNTAYAQSTGGGLNGGGVINSTLPSGTGIGSGASTQSGSTGGDFVPTTNPNATNPGASTFDQEFACVSFSNGLDIGNCFAQLMYEILTLFAWLLGAVGVLFAATMYYTVVTYGTLVNALTAITTAWGILRSFADMALLFTFVLIGIATILDIEQYGVRRLLPKLLIAAILLNFSLFITKSLIDIGDTFAVEFYKEINYGQVSQPSFNIAQEPISEAFMDATQLRTIYTGITSNSTGGKSILQDLQGNKNGAAIISIICFMGIILFTITAFVLLALTIMFVARAVTLIFLMIVSPVGFVASAVPGLSSQGSKWWRALINNVLFAPLVMLCILIAISMLQHGITQALGVGTTTGGINGVQGGVGLDAGAAPDVSGTTNLTVWADLLLVFAIAAGFIMSALIAGRQLSIAGANFAMSSSRKIISAPFNAAGWLTGVGYRNSVGRIGYNVGKWYNAKAGQWQQSGGFVTRNLARASRGLGIDESIAGALKKVSESKVGGAAGFVDRKKQVEERKKETTHAAEGAAVKTALAKGEDGKPEAAKLLQKMNQHGIEELIKESGTAQREALGDVLSADMYEKLVGSKDVSSDAQHALGHGRFGSYDGLTADVIGSMKAEDREELQRKIRDMSTKDSELLARYDGELFSEVVKASNDSKESLFRDEQNEAVAKSDRVSREARAAAKQNTRAGRVERWFTSSDAKDKTNSVALYKTMSGDAQAKVKTSLFTTKFTTTDASGKVVEKHAPTELLHATDRGGAQAFVAANKFNDGEYEAFAKSIEKRAEADPEERRKWKIFEEKNGLATSVIGFHIP